MNLKERFDAVAEMQSVNPKLTLGFELRSDDEVEQIYKRWIANGKPKDAVAADSQHHQTASQMAG